MDLVMSLLRFAHSWTRWLVLIVTVIAVAYLILALAQRKGWVKPGPALMSAFSSLIGLQWIIGLIFLVVFGSQTGFGVRHYWEHLTVMTIALVTAHGHFMLRRRAMPDSRRQGIYLALIVVTTLLVVVGIFALPETIQWRFYTG